MHPAAAGKNVVDMIITDLAVFKRTDHSSPFKLIGLAPGSRRKRWPKRPPRIAT